jgi:hypothetical protein
MVSANSTPKLDPNHITMFHNMKTEKLLQTIKIILDWLKSKQTPLESIYLLKVELFSLVSKHRSCYGKNVVNKMAKLKNTFCLLPYHCQLNPELIQSEVKSYGGNIIF